MKKKITSILLILTLLFSYVVTVQTEEIGFSDVSKSHWAYEYVTELVSEGLIEGMGDGTFRPDEFVTREQFMKLLVCALDCDIDSSTKTLFDVDENRWSAKYIAAGIQRGIYDVSEDGNQFYPDTELKRGVSAEWIVNGIGADTDATNIFSDVTDDNEQSHAIAVAADIDIVSGYKDNTFRPQNAITRAESAVLIKNIMDYMEERYSLREDAENEIVLQDNVKVAKSYDSVNIPISADENKKTVTFSDTDETIKEISVGDILYIPQSESFPNGLVGKVAKVNTASNTTIEFEEPELTEVVKSIDISTYISANADNFADDGELKMTGMVKGVTSRANGFDNNGDISANSNIDVTLNGVKVNVDAKANEKETIHFETESYKDKNGLYAAIDMSMEAKVDLKLETDNYDVTLFNASADLITDVNAVGGYSNSVSKEYSYELPSCTIPVGGVMNVVIDSSLVVQADGSLNIEATAGLHNDVGIDFTLSEGITTHNNTTAKAGITVDAEGSLEIGPCENFKLTLCGINVLGKTFFDGVSIIEVETSFGVGADGKTAINKGVTVSNDGVSYEDTSTDRIHNCYFCIEGDIYSYFDGNIGLGDDAQKLVNKICDKKLSYDFLNVQNKICDWHLSTGDEYTLEFELKPCPHYDLNEKELLVDYYEKHCASDAGYIFDCDNDGLLELIVFTEQYSQRACDIYDYQDGNISEKQFDEISDLSIGAFDGKMLNGGGTGGRGNFEFAYDSNTNKIYVAGSIIGRVYMPPNKTGYWTNYKQYCIQDNNIIVEKEYIRNYTYNIDTDTVEAESFRNGEEEITKERYEQGVNEITSLQVINTQSEYNPKDILKYADLIN